MRGRIKDLTFSRDGEQILSIATREDCRQLWDSLHDAEVVMTIKKFRKRRSLQANNYAWSLMEAIASETGQDKDILYEEMLCRYGTGETYVDENGKECKVLFSLREDVPPRLVARHYAQMGEGWINGNRFIHYRAIKGSSEYDTKEMSIFLDGIVSECKDLGIETPHRKNSLGTPRIGDADKKGGFHCSTTQF
jgi:hypothetical protein